MDQYSTLAHIMINYDIKKLNHTVKGDGPPLVLLHGWGCDHHIFNEVMQSLTDSHKVYAVDLPGFGKSPEPETTWGTSEYSSLIEWFFKENNITNPILICHSFGGRIAIDLTSRLSDIHALILTGAAGIKQKKSLSIKLKIGFYKALKKAAGISFLNDYERKQFKSILSKFGSTDYKKSTSMMRSILTRVVNEDLTPLLAKIKIPTLLIWGEKDTATPVRDGRTMNNKIPNSQLIVYKEGGHYAFLDQPFEFVSNVLTFLTGLQRD